MSLSASSIPLRRIMALSGGGRASVGLRSRVRHGQGQVVRTRRWMTGTGTNSAGEGEGGDKPPSTIYDVFPDLIPRNGSNANAATTSASPLTPSSSSIWDAATNSSTRTTTSRTSSPSSHRLSRTKSFTPAATADSGSRRHDRSRMAEAENAAFRDLLNEMFKGVETEPKFPSSSTGTSTSSSKSTNASGRVIPGLRPSPDQRAKRKTQMEAYPILSESDFEEPGTRRTKSHVIGSMKNISDEVWDEVNRIKETIEGIETDREIIIWAAENVFRPQVVPDVVEGENVSVSGTDKHSKNTTSTATYLSFPPTYPLVLAHLIATFRDRFKSPSLSLALFSHARSHSVESYISGCSTSVYNEVLRTHWESFRDINSLEDALEEMSVHGVGWDRHTIKLISGIVEEVTGSVLQPPSADGLTGTQIVELEYGKDVLYRIMRLEQRVETEVAAEERRHRAQMSRKLYERERTNESDGDGVVERGW